MFLRFITTDKNDTLPGQSFYPFQQIRKRKQLYQGLHSILLQKRIYINKVDAFVNVIVVLFYLSRVYYLFVWLRLQKIHGFLIQLYKPYLVFADIYEKIKGLS